MRATRHPLCTALMLRDLHDVPVDTELVERLARSFRRLLPKATRFMDRVYASLFAGHPELRSMFPSDLGEQQAKLLATLNLVVEQLASPEALLPQLHELGRYHADLGVRPAHYPLIVTAIVQAMADVAGPDWTPELDAEWRDALTRLGDIMLEGALDHE